MTSRECIIKTIRFQGADRLPIDFPEKYGSGFTIIDMDPSPDAINTMCQEFLDISRKYKNVVKDTFNKQNY